MFNLSLFTSKFNNNESMESEMFDVSNESTLYKFSNFKLAKTLILLKDGNENEILSFKNSLNKYIFDNFIELQRDRNSEEID